MQCSNSDLFEYFEIYKENETNTTSHSYYLAKD